MNRKLWWLVLAFAAAVQAAAPDAGVQQIPAFRPLPQQSLAAHMTARLLAQNHYKNIVLDDALSAKIFDRYLKSLDPERIVFLQADIDQWNEERGKMG